MTTLLKMLRRSVGGGTWSLRGFVWEFQDCCSVRHLVSATVRSREVLPDLLWGLSLAMSATKIGDRTNEDHRPLQLAVANGYKGVVDLLSQHE